MAILLVTVHYGYYDGRIQSGNTLEVRTCKYLNNIVEHVSDNRKLA
jgi:hypothetical protein